MNNVRLKPSKHLVIIEHILKFNHFFYWEKVKILDSEPIYNKRLISEMLYIKEQKHDINSKRYFLDDSYFCLLDTIFNLI